MMRKISGSLLLSIIATLGLFASNTLAFTNQDEVTCKEAAQNVNKLRIGMPEPDVVNLLGKPASIEKGIRIYNFWNCVPPPIPGTQTVVGLALTLNEGAVSAVDYATICAMGTPVHVSPPSPVSIISRRSARHLKAVLIRHTIK